MVDDDGLATDPFELVAVEARAAILRALAAHQADEPRDPTLSFAALRKAADLTDSGNFNYHLDKLQPEYVREVDGEYALTYAGLLLVGTLRAGVGGGLERGPEPLGVTCDVCGTELAAVYEDGMLAVTCENDHLYPRNGLPPNAIAGRDLEAVVAITTRRTRHHCELVRQGVCPTCYDDVDREYRTLDADVDAAAAHVLTATCDGCGMVFSAPFGFYLFREPAAVAFYHDHGVNLPETPFWAVDLGLAAPTVVSEDPLRLRLSVEREGERLTLTVDEHATLVDSDRSEVG